MIYLVCFSWLILTVATALWWLYLGLKMSATALGHDYKTMFMIEGFAFVSLIILGGVWLIYALRLSQKKTQALSDFLTTSSHEVKTAITNIRLQAGIISDSKDSKLERRSIQRLKDQCVRLETQLENSLLLAEDSKKNLYLQNINLNEFINRIKENWLALDISSNNLGDLYTDTRCLECIFSNAFQNALRHAQASTVTLRRVQTEDADLLEIETNGVSYSGPNETLGNQFFHHGPSGGSGIGLYLTKKIMNQMGGRAEFVPQNDGFITKLYFPRPT